VAKASKVTAFVLPEEYDVGEGDERETVTVSSSEPQVFGLFPGLWVAGEPVHPEDLGLSLEEARERIRELGLPLKEVRVTARALDRPDEPAASALEGGLVEQAVESESAPPGGESSVMPGLSEEERQERIKEES
jgi:hypothetical protein